MSVVPNRTGNTFPDPVRDDDYTGSNKFVTQSAANLGRTVAPPVPAALLVDPAGPGGPGSMSSRTPCGHSTEDVTMGRSTIAPIPFESIAPEGHSLRSGLAVRPGRGTGRRPPTRRKPLYTDDAPTLAAVDPPEGPGQGHRRAGPVDPVLAAAEGVYLRRRSDPVAVRGPRPGRPDRRARRPNTPASRRRGRGYEALFFDVRPRLEARDWIMYWVFCGGPGGVPPPGDDGEIWRWFGYFGGPHVLDEVVAVTRHPDVPHPRRARIERTIAALRLPAGVPSRRLDQLHLRVMADEVGAGPAAYHVDRPAGRRRRPTVVTTRPRPTTSRATRPPTTSQAKTVPAGAATE